MLDTVDPQSGKPTKQIGVRIGMGANGTQGGSISPTDAPIVVGYRMRVKDDAVPGDVPVRSYTEGTPPGSPLPGTYPSCAPTPPCSPTIVTIPPCTSAIDCGMTKPYCDTTGTLVKGQCSDRCKVNADCKGSAGGEVCDTGSGEVRAVHQQRHGCLHQRRPGQELPVEHEVRLWLGCRLWWPHLQHEPLPAADERPGGDGDSDAEPGGSRIRR